MNDLELVAFLGGAHVRPQEPLDVCLGLVDGALANLVGWGVSDRIDVVPPRRRATMQQSYNSRFASKRGPTSASCTSLCDVFANT